MPSWVFSLRTRLLLVLIPIVALATLLSLAGLDVLLQRAFRQQMEGQMAALGEVLKAALQQQMLRITDDLLELTLTDVGDSGEIRRLLIVDPSGRVAHAFPRSERGLVFDKTRDAPCRNCHDGGKPATALTSLTTDASGIPVFRMATKLPNQPRCQGCHGTAARFTGMLLVERDAGAATAVLATVRHRLTATWAVTLVVLALALLGVTTRYVHHPLQRLITAARRIGAGDFGTRVGMRGRDEVAAVGAALDSMAAHLADSVEEIRHQGLEMAVLYSIVERVSRSVFLEDLKPIVLDLTAEVLRSPRVVLVTAGPEPDEWEVLVRAAGADSPQRHVVRMPGPASASGPLPSALLRAWVAGEMTAQRLDPDTRGACLPLRFRERSLGLIVADEPRDRPFDADAQRLMGALANHCSVAFENARLYALVITDELTQVYSLRHFQLRLEEEVNRSRRYGQPVALLILDIDHFKTVNDRYGHPAGDVALREFGARLRAGLRSADVPCRYGGEEFGVILTNTDGPGALIVADRLRAAIAAAPIDLGDGVTLTLTVSVGVASYPADAATVRDLVGRADQAMYRAKQAGRNRVCDASSAGGASAAT